MIDLRSDTVTLPSPEMRRAMYDAELGDDVFGDDPTVRALEERSAALLGKEQAVFVTSGTQANLVAILAHCKRGDEIIMGAEAHIFHYELAGCAAIAGVQTRLVRNLPDGSLDPDELLMAIRRPDPFSPSTALICLENTQLRCGGMPLDAAQTAAIGSVAHQRGIAVHLDGARLFNAAVALGVAPAELTAAVDSVGFCISKGLGAPAGALLCGNAAFIMAARRWRKMLGGGMRQTGVLSAAGLYALDYMIDRLAEDHCNARLLAEGLATLPHVKVWPEKVPTNIVIADIDSAGPPITTLLDQLAALGVLGVAFGANRVRFVTHYGITRDHVEKTLSILGRVLAT